MMNKKIYLFIAIIALACLAIESTGDDWKPDPNSINLAQIQPVLDQLVFFICWPACLIIVISSGIASLLLILAGARYVAADDPGTRAGLRRLMTGIIIGLLIVLLAIPIINFVIAGLLPNVQCTCFNASTDNINKVLCNLINALKDIGPWICAIMVIYGGLRYLTSADDPGARKVAKTSIIAALVGMVIVMLAIPLVNIVLGDALHQVDCTNSDVTIPQQLITVLGNFLCILALIAPPICALVVTYGGLRYITSADDPGARDAAKTIIISALIGMILIMLAVPMVNVVFTASQIIPDNSCLQGTAVTEITGIMCNFMCFLTYIAPAICALVVIYGGLRYLVSGDDPGARKTAKTIIISAFVGMIFVYISIPIVNLVLTGIFKQVVCDKCQDSQSAKDIVNILCKFICLIASVAPAIAALAIIFGGLRYITSAEDPEGRSAAKTIIISALVGLILVMISLAMVNIVVSGWATDVQCGCFNVDPVAQINTVLCNLVCALQVITPGIAVLVIIYGGLKYLTSAEDPSARAAGRSIVINAVIGLVIVLLAVQIINAVITGLVPTFKCDCAQLFPSVFGQLVGAPADPKLHIQSADALCTNCCQVGKMECYYSSTSGGGGYKSKTGQAITKCEPPSGSGGYTIEWREGESVVPLNPPAGSKCSTEAQAMPCSSAADAPAKGPTFVYDTVKKDCVNKCLAGQNCCQTTDQNGKPGCIGTDTGNQVKLNSCDIEDYLTSYTCVSDKCTPNKVSCPGTTTCKDQYKCS